MSDNPRDTQFQGFAHALLQELCEEGSYVLTEEDELTIARRAYDFEAHTVGHTLEYLHECGIEMSGGMKTRIVPSIPDMTELPKGE